MNLWIFGDSFAEIKFDNHLGWEWQIQIANYFRCDLYNVSHKGSSSEWITLQLSKNWNKIAKDDIVIILIPYWDRQCIFSEDPDFNHLSTIENCNKDQKIKNRWNKYSKNQRDAFTKYFMHLHDTNLIKLKTSSLYAWINNLNLYKKPLVLETRSHSIDNYFQDNCVTAIGNLMDVSLAEWENINDWDTMTNRSLYIDPRLSHLVKKNHTVLANKIIDFFINDNLVNLNTGFYTKVINKENIDFEKKI
jgi:hypothetical protein